MGRVVLSRRRVPAALVESEAVSTMHVEEIQSSQHSLSRGGSAVHARRPAGTLRAISKFRSFQSTWRGLLPLSSHVRWRLSQCSVLKATTSGGSSETHHRAVDHGRDLDRVLDGLSDRSRRIVCAMEPALSQRMLRFNANWDRRSSLKEIHVTVKVAASAVKNDRHAVGALLQCGDALTGGGQDHVGC